MVSNKFILSLLLLINVNQIKSQNEGLSCVYSQKDYGYTCDLTIINPNGLNNFQDISGAHIAGKMDSDVTYVTSTSESNTTNIPSIICEKFQNLQSLFIGDFTEIKDYYYSNCQNLIYLYFDYMNIKEVYKNAFIENINAQIISFSRNGLTDLPANVFPKLGNNLTSLNLNYNKLKIVKPGWFKSLTNLEELLFGYNLIEEIPIYTFINCKKLKSIDMINNKLKVLSSKSFYDISILENFNFRDNQLYAIDDKFIYHPYYTSYNFENYYLFINNWCILEKPHKITTIEDYAICFENYQSWENGCNVGNTNGRICKLENDNQMLIDTVATKADQVTVDVLTKENQDLKSKVDILVVAVQSMQNQINVLNARL